MKDEIKEILNFIYNKKNYSNFIESQHGGEIYYILLNGEEGKILKDYITNLQSKIDKIITLTEPFINQKESVINGEILKRIYDIAKGE